MLIHIYKEDDDEPRTSLPTVEPDGRTGSCVPGSRSQHEWRLCVREKWPLIGAMQPEIRHSDWLLEAW